MRPNGSLVLCVAFLGFLGCGGSTSGGDAANSDGAAGPDLSLLPDAAAALDFAATPDLRTGPMGDDSAGSMELGVPPDQTNPNDQSLPSDFTDTTDYSFTVDLAPPIDNATPLDLSMPADLLAPPDLASPSDLVPPADLAPPPDLARPDLTAPTCSDGMRNGSETDVDCGGSCPPCGPGKGCGQARDCAGGMQCSAGKCTALQSCKDILSSSLGNKDGVYKLDPCNSGTPTDGWCDMTTRGGGWTVAGWQAANARTNMGIKDSGTVGVDGWSRNLACVPYGEIMVFNRTNAESFSESYPAAVWNATMTNMAIGGAGKAFKQGTYGPNAGTAIMMGCVDYAYMGAVFPEYGCDNDYGAGQRGHIADYAGEFCPGGRLDTSGKNWAWTDGVSCKYLGVMYQWGFALR